MTTLINATPNLDRRSRTKRPSVLAYIIRCAVLLAVLVALFSVAGMTL